VALPDQTPLAEQSPVAISSDAEALARRTPLTPLGAAVVASLLLVPAAGEAQEQTLSTVTVKASAEPQQDGYRATATRVGKTLQDPHDIPQAVTTVTQTLMEEQEANSLREALRNVSGLTFNAAEGGRSGDNMMLRGFYTFGDMYLDGIRDTAQYNREVFNHEQVDVLRGAAAMLFGRGQAGGVINQVSKTPTLWGIKKLGVGVGSDGYQEVHGDLNQVLNDTTAIRLNFMKRDEGSPRVNPLTGTAPEIHRQGIAPSIVFGLGTDHEVTLSHLWLQSNDRPDYGVPFASDHRPNQDAAKSGKYWGISGNFDESETSITTASYLYKISPDTQWRTVARSGNYQRAYWALTPQTALSTTGTQGNSKTRAFNTDNFVVQSDFNTAFNLWGMRNELVTGAEYLKEASKRWTLKNLGTAAAPLYKSGFLNGNPNAYSGDTVSAYVQDTLEFVPHWKATVGLRRDEMKANYTTAAGSSFKGDFGQNSYRAGLSWQPTTAEHYYLSWSDSFSPTVDLYQLSGNKYPAERAKVSELGAKWNLFEGRLALRAALYRATKDWERNNDLDADTAPILTRKRRTDGLELELAGRVTDNWEVFSGLSLMDAEILQVAPGANPNFVGKTPRNTPKQTFNLWSTYNLGNGWKAGGGMEYKSRRTGYSPTQGGTAAFNPNYAPSYTRWDAMVSYDHWDYTVKLNVQNLFDKVYYDAIYDNGGFVYVGQPRRAILSVEYKF